VVRDYELVAFHGMIEIHAVDECWQLNDHLLVFRKELVVLDLVCDSSAFYVLLNGEKVKLVSHVHHEPHVSDIVAPVSVPQKRRQ